MHIPGINQDLLLLYSTWYFVPGIGYAVYVGRVDATHVGLKEKFKAGRTSVCGIIACLIYSYRSERRNNLTRDLAKIDSLCRPALSADAMQRRAKHGHDFVTDGDERLYILRTRVVLIASTVPGIGSKLHVAFGKHGSAEVTHMSRPLRHTRCMCNNTGTSIQQRSCRMLARCRF